MQYVSTRGASPPLDFRAATLAGLAPDGGLYLPAEWPRLTPDAIAALAGLSYADTAAAVLAPFVGDALAPGELAALAHAAYARFGHPAVTPLVQLDADQWLLELFRGPTLAFKDVALQLLGRLFERFLGAGERLTVIGATSGDTGSAAIDALAGRAGVELVMLHPAGRVSDVQRRQMTTVLAPNVRNVALANASFDDAQGLVKAMFADPALAAGRRLAAVNSINWARLAAQVAYYFYAAVRLGAPERAVAFAVPTGNFGDVFAGYAALQMGLPIERLIVATNENDIVARALADGDYARGPVHRTAAPSMDIQVSSNFERLLFDAGGRDGAAVAAQLREFETTGALRLTDRQRAGAARFAGERVDDAAMAAAMAWAWDAAGELVDPHTAIGLAAARRAAPGLPAGTPVVTLATAHPAKFPDAVARATGVVPALPPRLADLHERPERYDTLPNDYATVAAYVAARA